MAKRKQTRRKPAKQPEKRSNSLIVLIVLGALSLLLAWIAYFAPEEIKAIVVARGVLEGLFGNMTAVPSVLLLHIGLYQAIARQIKRFSVLHLCWATLLALCVLTGAELLACPAIKESMQFYTYPNFVYNAYLAKTGGGVVGSLAWLLNQSLDVVGGMIILGTVVLVLLALIFGLDIRKIWDWLTDTRTKHETRREKRRERRELDEMFDYDDFEERPRPRSERRTAAASQRKDRERTVIREEAPIRSRAERTRPVQRPMAGRNASVLDEKDNVSNVDYEIPDIEGMRREFWKDEDEALEPMRAESRLRRNPASRRAAAPEQESPRAGRTAAPLKKPAAHFEDFDDDEDIDIPQPMLHRHAEPKKPAADPFAVRRTVLKDDSPIDGNDFAGGHIRDVHGQSMLHGQSIGGTIDRRPAPPVREKADEDLPLSQRDLTIEPIEFETPDDDEPPFDVEEQPAKKLGTFTRRTPREETDEYVYNYPPLDLLAEGSRAQRDSTEELDLERAQELEDTLSSFGVDAKISGIAHGPAVTRFEFQIPSGVKVNKITSLTDDIAYSMAAESVRIEAPIPGKKAVGVELPNAEVETVLLRDVLESTDARNHPSRVAVCLGKDNAGRYIVADIAKMPHVLIAGQTGSGKSVCINAIIISLLFRASPEEVKLIMIDPKVVELSVYNEIPHLIAPVVTDPQKAAAALDWAVVEMDNRYKKFASVGVRNIKGYNSHLPEGEKPMPQIVIIIDELADLMITAPGEVETSINRLAQLARAAGMHLIIATQRPSVNVITGKIKANIPSRIAFKVASNIDSRTIFDSAGGVGAETLLGNGDMLFVPSGKKPMRVQGAWVSDSEVENVVEFVKARHENGYDETFMEHMNRSTTPDAERDEAIDEECDELLEEAIEIVLELGQASISMLQRRMRVGYARAGRLIDEMCRRGIVSEANGSKPRTVLITKEQFYNAFADEE